MRTQRAFTMVEILIVLAIISILATIAIPEILGARDKARNASCDAFYNVLDGELANQLETALGYAKGTPMCGCTTNTCVMECALNRHYEALNPRNRWQNAYGAEGDTNYQPCQVALGTFSTNGVLISQSADGSETRTFHIAIH